MKSKKRVVIGLLGNVKDNGQDDSRWGRWRPTVSLFQHDDFLIHRMILIHDNKTGHVAKTLVADIASVSPETKVSPHLIPFANAWDFEEVYGAFHDFAKSLKFDPEEEEYLVHITTGSHVQ